MSIKCKGALHHEASWYIGVTKTISVEGMTIEVASLPKLEIPSQIELFCFPKEERLISYIPEPEPARMKGSVIWQNEKKNLLGIEILSS